MVGRGLKMKLRNLINRLIELGDLEVKSMMRV